MTSLEQNESEKAPITAEDILGHKFGENVQQITVKMNNGEVMNFTSLKEMIDYNSDNKHEQQ